MRRAEVEIYSDETNAAILRHPGRRFPGVLVQGDSLHVLCFEADALCASINPASDAFRQANELRNKLQAFKTHYKQTLVAHGIPMPFSED